MSPGSSPSNEHITKYQTLYKNRFGKEISREEACEHGIKLMRLVGIVYQPMTEDEFKIVQERRKLTGLYD